MRLRAALFRLRCATDCLWAVERGPAGGTLRADSRDARGMSVPQRTRIPIPHRTAHATPALSLVSYVDKARLVIHPNSDQQPSCPAKSSHEKCSSSCAVLCGAHDAQQRAAASRAWSARRQHAANTSPGHRPHRVRCSPSACTGRAGLRPARGLVNGGFANGGLENPRKSLGIPRKS